MRVCVRYSAHVHSLRAPLSADAHVCICVCIYKLYMYNDVDIYLDVNIAKHSIRILVNKIRKLA